MKPTLIIMAAGMGSRFGGLKQVTPVGPTGQKIIDYSVYDAVRAGFGKVVFVIKKAIEQEFKEKIGDAIAAHIPVEYAYQELDALPQGYTVPEGREKPWGTGHAVLCCRALIEGPFVVVNADDYYGPECFRLLADFLSNPTEDGRLHIAMAGYCLRKTMTENGSVSRGVCSVDENGRLTGIVERTRIELREGHPEFTEDGGESWHPLPEDTVVSMNCWAFPSGSFAYFDHQFRQFLDARGSELRSEFYLPSVVSAMMGEGVADVQVLPTADTWYGMTYAEDHPAVKAALQRLTDEGLYPTIMWDK